MKRICIYGLRRDRKAILELLQRAGAVEVRPMTYGESPDGNQKQPFGRMDVSSSMEVFRKALKNTEEALQIFGTGTLRKKVFLLVSLGGAERSEKKNTMTLPHDGRKFIKRQGEYRPWKGKCWRLRQSSARFPPERKLSPPGRVWIFL